jgi:two-component system chemotaxis sensor kinase CheA
MPLIDVSAVLPERRALGRVDSDAQNSEEVVQVVVHAYGGHSVGIVVDQILDIVDDHVEIHRPGGRDGVIGTAVIRDRVTEFIDIAAVIESVAPDFFEATKSGRREGEARA